MKNHDQPDGRKDRLMLDSSLRRSDRELEVVQILEDLDSELEQDHKLNSMYQGALRVLDDKSNPDRFSQAANSIRELMDKLPEYLNIPTGTKVWILKNKVRELLNEYKRIPAEKFLKRLGDFFNWFESNNPTRKDQMKRTLRKIDVAYNELDDLLAKREVESWDGLRRYFLKILHHGVLGDEKEFRIRLGQLEGIILNKRKPQTSDDFNEIDKILKEGNYNA